MASQTRRRFPSSPAGIPVAIALCIVLGCENPGSEGAADTGAATRVPANVDSSRLTASGSTIGACDPGDAVLTRPLWVNANQDSLRVVIDRLDKEVASASDVDLPRLLLERGRARTRYSPRPGTPHAAYAKTRPDDFRYNEIGAGWLYNGSDFRALAERFPTSDLVDDAAYATTHLGIGGECEGYTSCYIERSWAPLAEFMKDHPESPFADSAVTRALSAFAQLDSVSDLSAATEYYDPKEARRLVASLDSIGYRLQGARRARVLNRVGQLWDRFGDYGRARDVYSAAIAASPDAEPCIAPRLASLPTRTFQLEPVRIIHTRRVELRWRAPDPVATEFVIHRSTSRDSLGPALVRLPATTSSWSDTTTAAETTWWYRIVALSGSDTVRSNPAAAEIPDAGVRVQGIAVSTTDRRLHLFGALWNGFPQVIRLSPDGSSAERFNAMFIGPDNEGMPINPQETSLDDLWLVDGNGQGVLRFDRGNNATARNIMSVMRRGHDVLVLAEAERQHRVLVSIDEPARAAWAAMGGGGAIAPIAMDCLAVRSSCWTGGEFGVTRLDSAGRTIAKAKVTNVSSSSGWVRSVYADPKDGSAWALLRDLGRLVNVDTLGTVRHDIAITDPKSSYSITMTPDFDRRMIWLTRRGATAMELARIDVDAPAPKITVVTATDVPSLARLAPDLAGGVWMVSRREIRHVDASGRTLLARPFPD